MVSAATTMSGIGSQASDASVFVPVKEGSPDSLELMVGHQRALLEIDGLPGQAENLALAKTENQDQDVGGVQRIGGGTGGFEKAPGFLARPGHDLALALLGNLYKLSDIALDQFLAHCRVQR
jgi:hypothetical protein